jgi:hypothetical protein
MSKTLREWVYLASSSLVPEYREREGRGKFAMNIYKFFRKKVDKIFIESENAKNECSHKVKA